ncbi:hypothetical protein AMTRI_Chr04g186180 [Amborella trichopoda]
MLSTGFLEHGAQTDPLRGWSLDKQLTGLRKLWTNMETIITPHSWFEADFISMVSDINFRVDGFNVFYQWCHYLIGFAVPHEMVCLQCYGTQPSSIEFTSNSASANWGKSHGNLPQPYI